jgi:prepilin-type N-terminal cleavage/methylation domain-containing protein
MTRKNKGFTLLELMITIMVISIGILGIFGLISNTMQSAEELKSRLVATYLAQEGIELVRNSRDNNWKEGKEWTDGWPNCSLGCRISYDDPIIRVNGATLNINSDGFYGNAGTGTQFTRTIYITGTGDYREVRAVVSWLSQEVQVIKRLYNWH